MIPVVWFAADPDCPPRGFWDQAIVEDLLAGNLWRPSGWPDFEHHEVTDGWMPEGIDGCVLIVAARHHASGDRLATVRAVLDRLSWCVLILTGDEENDFPREGISGEHVRVWVQTPESLSEGERALPNGYGPQTRPLLAALRTEATHRPLDWFYAGQVNTPGREALMMALGGRPGVRGRVVATEGFLQGMPQPEYVANLASARVAPCPSGPFTPDTFRFAEALEAGCAPFAEAGSVNRGDTDYWRRVYGPGPLWPIGEMSRFDVVADAMLSRWPYHSNRIWAWWRGFKRRMAMDLLDDLRAVGAPMPTDLTLDERITVLVPTSSTPDDPSTAALEQVIASIRDRLPNSPILLLFDGIRGELAHRADDYAAYIHRALWLCHHRWTNVLPILADRHIHQSGLTKLALDLVDTPLVLFVEHDTPLVGEIEWDGLAAALDDGLAGVIRLHHEASVLPDHLHLMLGEREHHFGVPLWRTVQWSQRPHLARTDLYRFIMSTYFGAAACTMIEDVMHGVVSTNHRVKGVSGWALFGLWMYVPDGDTKRSGHLDTRGDDPKASCFFEYDGEIPFGAPTPTSMR